MGVVAGLRVFTPLALVSWAARLGGLDLGPTRLDFLGYAAVPWLLTALAVSELITDQLPRTPSRKVPAAFGARMVSGAICGIAIGIRAASPGFGMLLGVFGAVVGTLGGASARARLAGRFGRDRPAALLEDTAAVGLALLVTMLVTRVVAKAFA